MDLPTPYLHLALKLKDNPEIIGLVLEAKSFEDFQQKLADAFLHGLEEQHYMLTMRHLAPTVHQNFKGEPLVEEYLEEPIAEFEALIQKVRDIISSKQKEAAHGESFEETPRGS